MIAKGTAHNNGAKLARYMITGKEGERAELFELFGFASDDITDAFRDVHIMAEATRCQKPFFHVQVRNPEGEGMPREDWKRAADRIESILGLKGQPRAISFHIDEKTGDEHMHVAWSRIDEETLKARPLPFYKLRLKRVARELEAELGITIVANERDGPIAFAPTRGEDEQARRLGVDIHATRNAIRSCYDNADCGHSFDDALAEAGLILAQGDRYDYIVIDQAGGIHALGKRLLGVSTRNIREKLDDLDRDHLPTEKQARELVLDLPHDRMDGLQRELAEIEKQIAAEREYLARDPVREEMEWLDAVAQAAIEKEKVERAFVAPEDRKKPEVGVRKEEKGQGAERPAALRGVAAKIWEARQGSDSAQAFRAALAEQGIGFAAVTREEAARSHMNASFAREVGNFAAEYREGEIVAVTEKGQVYGLNRRTLGKEKEEIEAYLAPLDRGRLHGIEATCEEMRRQRVNEKHWPAGPAEATLNSAPATSPELHFQDATRAIERPESAPTMPQNLRGAAADIWAAYNIRSWDREWERENADGTKELIHETIEIKGGRDPFRFAEALEEKGLALARVTKAEAEHSQKEAAHWKTHNEKRPVYQESEFVAVTRDGDVWSLSRRNTGQAPDEAQRFLSKADWKGLLGIEATKAIMRGRAGEREAYWRDIREEIAAARLERAGNPKDRSSQGGTASDLSRGLDRVIGGVMNEATKPIDAIFSLFYTPKSPAQLRKEAVEARIDREVQTDRQIDFSKYSAERSQDLRNEQEQQAARDRQRESERER